MLGLAESLRWGLSLDLIAHMMHVATHWDRLCNGIPGKSKADVNGL